MSDERTQTKDEAVVATPETTEEEAKPKAKPKANRMTEDELLADYPHVKVGSLGFLATEQKQVVTISCQHPKGENGEVCGRERKVRTSDLWQVNKCDACTRKVRRENAKARRKAKKAKEAGDQPAEATDSTETDES